MTHQIQVLNVEGSKMEVFVFEPEGKGPFPGLVQCMHIPVGHTGIENDEFTLKTAKRYQDNGYVVVVPFIFHWWPKSAGIEIKRDEFRDDWTKLDLDASFNLISGMENVDSERIGIFGHCWGGRVSWFGAGTNSKYKACAVFYGGRIKKTMGEINPPAIDLSPKIKCPVIGFFGNEDQNPSPEDVNDYSRALTDAGVEHEFHRYDYAGHAFQRFNIEEKYSEDASEDAWTKVLDFFREKI